MSAEQIGFGIVGCGSIAPSHLQAIEQTQDARLVALCDIIPEKAEKLAQGRAVTIYADYAEMLQDPAVEAVCICTPSGLHGEMAIAAARAGKHVLSEKPMDVKVAKAREMIRVCRDAGVKLAVIFQRRTHPATQRIRQAVQEGELGRMFLGDAYLKYYRDQAYYDSGDWRGTWELDGGALMNQGVHCIDQLQWIMGPVERVVGKVAHLARDIEAEDVGLAVLNFRSGAMGVLEGTTLVNPSFGNRLEFHGERGSIAWDEGIARWVVNGEDLTEKVRAEVEARMPEVSGHTLQVRDLVEAIITDRKPLVSGEEGLHAVEIVNAVYESSRTDRPVELPSPNSR